MSNLANFDISKIFQVPVPGRVPAVDCSSRVYNKAKNWIQNHKNTKQVCRAICVEYCLKKLWNANNTKMQNLHFEHYFFILCFLTYFWVWKSSNHEFQDREKWGPHSPRIYFKNSEKWNIWGNDSTYSLVSFRVGTSLTWLWWFDFTL